MQLRVFFKKKLTIFVLLVTIVIAVLLSYFLILLSSHTFYKGIYVEGINLSGLNKAAAKDLISKEHANALNVTKVDLYYKDETFKLDLSEISFSFLVDNTINNAYDVGRSGNIIKRIRDIFRLRFNEQHFKIEYYYDREMLKNVLNVIKSKLDNDEKNAKVLYTNGNITIINEIPGRFVDIDKSVKIIENHIEKRDLQNINIFVEEITPKIISSEINEIKSILSSFSTSFNTYDENRSQNIRLACERLNNKILYPGEVFSMDKALGPRTTDNGYLEAPVILKNELIKGTGGGVCQVTSTLYDAVLKSKLKVVERTNHSIPLGYVGPGQDATIAEGYIDFKFENDRNYPICLNAEVTKNKLIIRLLGKKEAFDDNIVKLRSELLEEYFPKDEELIIDDSLQDTDKIILRQPIKGYKAAVYRETYNKSGEIIQSEKISEDIYNFVKPQFKVNSNYLNSLNHNLAE